MVKFLAELYTRITKEETPEFFKKLRGFAVSIVVGATALWVANKEMDLLLPEDIITVCKYIIAIGIATGLTATTAKKT